MTGMGFRSGFLLLIALVFYALTTLINLISGLMLRGKLNCGGSFFFYLVKSFWNYSTTRYMASLKVFCFLIFKQIIFMKQRWKIWKLYNSWLYKTASRTSLYGAVHAWFVMFRDIFTDSLPISVFFSIETCWPHAYFKLHISVNKIERGRKSERERKLIGWFAAAKCRHHRTVLNSSNLWFGNYPYTLADTLIFFFWILCTFLRARSMRWVICLHKNNLNLIGI